MRDEPQLLADQLAHPPFGSYRAAGARVRVSAYRLGGDVLINAWTAHDLEVHARRGAACLARLGLAQARAVSHLLPGALAPIGELERADVLDCGTALDVPVGPLESDAVAARAWEVWRLVRPRAVLGPPAELLRLAAHREWRLGEEAGIELLVAVDEGPLDPTARRTIAEGTGLPVSEVLGVRCLYPFLGTRNDPREPFAIDAEGVDLEAHPSGRLVVTARDLTDAPLTVLTRLRGALVGQHGGCWQVQVDAASDT